MLLGKYSLALYVQDMTTMTKNVKLLFLCVRLTAYGELLILSNMSGVCRECAGFFFFFLVFFSRAPEKQFSVLGQVWC